MNKMTDLPLKTITTYFFRLDLDYRGEMNFIEFQLLCCFMIAAKVFLKYQTQKHATRLQRASFVLNRIESQRSFFSDILT